MTIHQKSSAQTQEAVIFFVDGEIRREMLYPEFEALLDCVVPIRDFAGKTLEAAYLRLDARLAPVTVVLFLIPFDSDGFPALEWDVPLRMLAERGVRGPDLGGGPVRLVTRSQCPIPRHEDQLWDIRFGAGGNTLAQLQERVLMNRLGLDVAEADTAAPPAAWRGTAAPAAAVTAPATAPAAAGDSSDTLLALMQQSSQQMAAAREQHQRESMALQQQLAVLQQHARALEDEKQALLARAEQQARTLEDQRAAADTRTRQLAEQARREIEAARQTLEGERDAALAARDARMREALARLERERETQEDQLHSLRSELTELRRDKLRLMGEGADKFFAQLKEKGVKFVAFQPGAGHLTIPMEELNRYLEETEAFVAEKCGVSPEHYRRWLAHYNSPVCQGTAGSGGPCAKALTKLLKPAEFVVGMHDRCEIHKQFPRTPATREMPG
ncbi:MAG: hypothetical protein KBG29_13905 [Pseudomonadales bacterium]|jgi:hypothetical protein|nr:hypothetical protein [Pseudomonadales bacterium]MBP9034990.1 hypothetical protein [Pseudomonadales bacterium]